VGEEDNDDDAYKAFKEGFQVRWAGGIKVEHRLVNRIRRRQQ
jgi:hypothetical protein